jgi:hypothetical protein
MIVSAPSASHRAARWLGRLAGAAPLVALAGVSVVRATRPPAPVPATAPDTVFSAERALRHDSVIAQRPHPTGSAEHARVRDYVVAQLAALGLEPEVQTVRATSRRYRASGEVENVLARAPGRAAGGKAVLLVAHYDGVPGSPAAADDGAGVSALLETLRAIRSRRQPLAHDVIALFTDREESGLLGAAAFVHDHPWAKDVAFVVNLEARGTRGRSMMFETGPGNLDAVRVLRGAGDVMAGSVFTTLYHMLPNDTDLSELSALHQPALNFAFVDGARWYHTPSDDLAHLDAGSVQHHGQQMLSVAITVGDGPLPRPVTGNAVFFDFPLTGLVVYPEWLAVPLALLALVLVLRVVGARPAWREALVGAGAMIASIAVAIVAVRTLHVHLPASWVEARGAFAAGVALVVAAFDLALFLWLRARYRRVYDGALLVWLLLAVVTTTAAPATSYLFVWPLLFAAVAARSQRGVAWWIAAAFTLMLLVGFTYGASVILLGLNGLGVMALVALTSLIVWLLAPVVAEPV